MTSERRSTAGFMVAVFGGILSCLVLAAPAYSVESLDSASQTPLEELVELDEVKVRGKLVANAVITAENRLFRRARVEARYAELLEERRVAQKARREAARAGGRTLRTSHPRFP